MDIIKYFKLQAKNLLKDFKENQAFFENRGKFEYEIDREKYFKVSMVFADFNVDETNFKLGNSQHVIAKMVGFTNWSQLVKASNEELELAKLYFDFQDRLEAPLLNKFAIRSSLESKKLEFAQELNQNVSMNVYFDCYKTDYDSNSDDLSTEDIFSLVGYEVLPYNKKDSSIS